MTTYYPPTFQGKQFNCVHCGVYSAQVWSAVYQNTGNSFGTDPHLRFCRCIHCGKPSYWFDGRMMVPSEAPVPPPHTDLPDICKADYDEARDIVARSPRGASALLRLVLQKLMPELGKTGKNINDDIASLVQDGLPLLVQKALDFCRVVGNNAVHPGELQFTDTPEIAHNLFAMLNFIVEDRITRPKQIQALYETLPPGAIQAIEKRDNGAAKA